MATQTTASSSYQSASKTGGRTKDPGRAAGEKIQSYGNHFVSEPAHDLASQFRQYAKEKPDVAAMWCFAVGLLVGWKLRG